MGKETEVKAVKELPTKNSLSAVWLRDERYEAVLRTTRTIAFEFDPLTGRQETSPFISEYLAGNYDGRMLSDVMLEDGVIYPDDLETSLRFRDKIKSGGAGEMTIRLLTPSGEYRWYRMSLTPCPVNGRQIYVGILTDVDEETRQKQTLRYRAEYDPVSGIFNKSTFFDATRKLLEAHPDNLHFLIRFDIDRFKIVNELYSISEGDLVLRHMGSVLRELTRPGETYARMGDDVFCACLSRSEEETTRMIKDLERRINEYPMSFQFILSVGIVRLSHYQGEPVNILCDRAAMAQRIVKGSYIQTYAFYEDRMGEALNREHYITGCMRQALESGQFLIYLQPKFDMRDNRVIGAEALARWNHPSEGMIPPSEFVPLFERNGFILSLDEYIWELACQTIRGWLDGGLDAVPVSVNVSRVHLYDPAFCEKVLGLCGKYRLPSSLLELEITETAYAECPRTLYTLMDRLQSSGFLFSMDDFGSGYSSLNVLKDIPVDTVKFDLSFLQEARRGQAVGRGVLKGAIQLVRGMNLSVIAEGVETKEQADFLLSVGCNCAQGYYYAKPMPVKEFEALLRRQKDRDEK